MVTLGSQRGSALLLTVVIGLVVLGMGSAFFLLAMAEGKTQESLVRGSDALLVVEAGISRAVQELRSDQDYDGDGTVGSAAGMFNAARYAVVLSDPGDGTFILTGEAEKNGTRRALEIRVAQAPALPVPGVQAALAILGQLGKKGKVDLHLKKPSKKGKDKDGDEVDDDDDEEWTSESTSPVAVDGKDASGIKPTLPAVGIEDPETYKKVTEKLAEEILKGKIPKDVLLGDPMNTIYDKKGNEVESSIVPLNPGSSSLNYESLNEIAGKIETHVDDVMIPEAQKNGTVITGNDAKINSEVTYGSPSNPTTVYVDAKKLEVQPGAKITGYGDLIISGDVSLLNDSQFNWTGNIIVMGGKNNDAVFKNKKGQLTVDGTVIVLGTNDKKKKSKLELHNDIDQTNQGNYTKIDGSVLVITGDNGKQADKAEFKAKHGHFDIDGFIGMYGDKVKLDVKIDDKKHAADGHFNVQGGIVVAVPSGDEKHKAKVHLHGDDILVNYHSANVEKAIARLMALAGKIPSNPFPTSYQILSWREIPAPGLLAAKK